MTKKESIERLMKELYVPSSLEWEAKNDVIDYVSGEPIRSINKNDEGRIGYLFFIIKTKGNPPRESFAGTSIQRGDVFKVSDKFALIALYDEDGNAKPLRVALSNPRYSIIANQ